MSELIALRHVSHYHYARNVFLSPHLIRLCPSPLVRTPIKSYTLQIEPAGHFLNWQIDAAGNRVARVVFPSAVSDLKITVDLTVELTPINPFDFFLDPQATNFPFTYVAAVATQLAPYRNAGAMGQKLSEWLTSFPSEPTNTVAFLGELDRRLRQRVGYHKRFEPGVQSPEQTLALGGGSCRDSAWLLVESLRQLGLAARFVSGYWIQLPAGASDAAELHAWAEVYLPGAGWIGLDATTGLFCDEKYLPLAYGVTPSDAAPVSGRFSLDPSVTSEESATHAPRVDQFDFELQIHRIDATPGTTDAISDAQWADVESLARKVDNDLRAGDVRLTMGGEPTFVDLANPNLPEWNAAALGPTKYGKGVQLLDELRSRFAPHGVIHDGVGKWYPGEPQPRWALGLFWRTDGQPVWNDPSLLQPFSSQADAPPRDRAKQLLESLCEILHVDSQNVIAGYEDAWHDAWREQRLPANIDPLDPKLRSAADRAKSIALNEAGDQQLIGYALPLRIAVDRDFQTHFLSGGWKFRRGKMYLGTFGGPMGGRLPLDTLEWVPPDQFPSFKEVDPNERRQSLPPHDRLVPATALQTTARVTDTIVRTAVVAEVRDGALRVYLPPVERLEGFLSLLAAIERAAAQLKQPVILEGYGPPIDSRLNGIKVTPDPGVIEVNTHPAANWDELTHNTLAIYDAAKTCGLAAEKFQYDGRHTGTGGGNHVLLGGATPGDSPILRRPDLLGSLLRYWQNHPSLSYLFSGLFVGPTSQAPRVDEARTDQLHELEIALRQIPPAGTENLPWTIDRLLRNILVDSTGNTHRAEFCIDKLFVPQTVMGRLGLLELRALEMPPNPRMGLVQLLLIRALVALFWRQPNTRPLIRWGTSLHDRFMLPHFLKQDFEQVLGDLAAGGYALSADWFAAQLEFRFPHLGRVERDGVSMELRQAIEPWHVIGDEAAGAARMTDSTLARVQVLLRGIVAARHLLACNGVRVPLHPTGITGEYVAGIRYRAWPSPNGLHPTIAPHTPLKFDLIDTWTHRTAAGCTFHSADPAGRFYPTLPVDAREAEIRRSARFIIADHHSLIDSLREPTLTNEFALTLDLRLQ